jgi:hypothetical protein
LNWVRKILVYFQTARSPPAGVSRAGAYGGIVRKNGNRKELITGDSDPALRRVSGYTDTPQKKSWWDSELERVIRKECLQANTGMGLLLGRIADFKLKLDFDSLKRTVQGTDEEPAELTHKPVKRAPARAC